MLLRPRVDMEDEGAVFTLSESKAATLDLPDPTELPSEPAEPRQNADDLIASMADQQIEQMLADADVTPEPEAATEVAPSLPAPDDLVDKPAVEPQAALDAVKEAVDATTAPDPAPAVDSAPAVEAAADAPTPVEIPAAADGFPSPTIDSILQSTAPTAHAPSLVDMTSKVATPSREDLHDEPLEDSAAAVARELDADKEIHAAEERDAKKWFHVTPRVSKALRFLAATPLLAFQAFNYPFQSLSDRAREIVAAIALMTLFNSIAILIYVIAFR
jgi:hypothetical protein